MIRPLVIPLIFLNLAVFTLPVTSAQATSPNPPGGFINTLMPQPSELEVQQERLGITASFSVAVDRFRDARLESAITRTVRRIENRTGISIPPVPADGTSATLIISVEKAGETIQSVDEDEAYSLEVTSANAHIRAATVVGAMHGLATLEQLIQSNANGYFIPAVQIHDTPRFRWRGLMIDCGRHFIPVDVLKRTLDGMASVKLNVFHWHLSEDQGFRIESKAFPKLTELGSDGLFYTQEQAREIVVYARDRGIRVVPEFDMPGHTSAWFVGYPDLASAPGPFHIERKFGVFDPVMDPTRESTYKFLDTFLGEMAAIFPDHFMHIGGDENNGVEWKANPRIQSFMREHKLNDTAALQNYFNQRLLKILEKHGKHMVGWDEILTPDLPKDIMVQSWRGFDSLAAGARNGYNGILSAGYYLNLMSPAEAHYAVDPLPANTDLSPEQQARILGGEACMWEEQTSGLDIDSRIWPRTAVIAERLWSSRSVNDVDDMYRRLEIESLRLETFGLTHISQEGVSLRQLSGTRQIAPLHILASILEPVPFDQRAHQQHANQLTPLDLLVDALPPDPPSRHDFESLMRAYLQNPAARTSEQTDLTAEFKSWISAEPGILRLMTGAPLLAQAEPRAQQLTELGMLGLEAVSYLSSGTPAAGGWKAAKLAALDDAEKPQALVRFTVTKPLRDLVNAVAEAPSH
ncbi:MAG TPA: family 20 glycosylhydrolase [Candidatus Sulfotelmatobacter sp.]|jgi:hexosaminidase|nr:family 20 glycosylhydrolase [Candidatus Sulfotelmatobacter sp.]